MNGDSELLAATARGEADAFAVFYRRHLPRVLGFLLRATGDRELTADLAGEVFAAALAAAGRYRPERDSAAPWLLGIAHNKLRESRRRGRIEDAVRRRLRIAPLDLGDADLRRVEELAALDDGPALNAVTALGDAEREAVRARIVDERGYAEIAAELRCSESVVRQRVSRGLSHARARIAHSERREQE
ncbi:MAG: RNA polymerase sigma factor [Solirubrobacteraceae bacterium]